MQVADPHPDVSLDRQKTKIWNRLKRRNSSSPSLHGIGVKNWSTRSLPRFGSFGSSSVGSPRSPSAKSNSPVSPVDDAFCFPEEIEAPKPIVVKDYFSALPSEVKLRIFSLLPIKTIARASTVCKQWRILCTDGTLYTTIDTRTFYKNITSPVLLSMMISAGPFLRHLNLRGCAQLCSNDLFYLASRATNLVSLSLEGCPIADCASLSSLLQHNPSLRVLDVSGLRAMTDEVAADIALYCTNLEALDIGWCNNLTGVGLLDIVSFCTKLKRLRLCEMGIFKTAKATDVMLALNSLSDLQSLVLSGCRDITDDMLRFYLRGEEQDPFDEEEIRPLPIRQLNLSRIPHLSDATLRNLARVSPHLQRLELAGSSHGSSFSNAGYSALLPHTPNLTHLDLEDNHLITDSTLHLIASLPLAKTLIHLQLSYCLELTDAGLVRILENCPNLRNLEVDNTQAGDGMLMAAPRVVSRRSGQLSTSHHTPVGLRIAAYDCGAITWVGVSEILAQNLWLTRTYNHPRSQTSSTSSSASSASSFENDTYASPLPIIRLKCTFEWQRLVDAHTRRCLRGEYAAAEQIALGFSRWMMDEAEEGAWGGHARRRRRRALGLAEQADEAFVMGVGRRRLRAFSAPSSCLVM